jgi:hypothetical protein
MFIFYFESFAQLEVSKLSNSLIFSLTLYGNDFWGAAPKGTTWIVLRNFLNEPVGIWLQVYKNYVLSDKIRERQKTVERNLRRHNS